MFNLSTEYEIRVIGFNILAAIKLVDSVVNIDLYSMDQSFETAELTKMNEEVIKLSSTTGRETIKKAFKFGKYLVFDTLDIALDAENGAQYVRRIYFMFRPNYFTVLHEFVFENDKNVNIVLKELRDPQKPSLVVVFTTNGIGIN